jgi:hypothetical protein
MLSGPSLRCSQIERAKKPEAEMNYRNILQVTVMILVPLVLIVLFFFAK